MKKLLLTLIAVCLINNGCFLLPSNCTVTLTSGENTFSFDCMKEDVETIMNGIQFNDPAIKESDNVYSMSNVSIKAWHGNGEAKINIMMHCYPFHTWKDGRPAITFDCKDDQWDRFIEKTGITIIDSLNTMIQLDSVSIKMEIRDHNN